MDADEAVLERTNKIMEKRSYQYLFVPPDNDYFLLDIKGRLHELS